MIPEPISTILTAAVGTICGILLWGFAAKAVNAENGKPKKKSYFFLWILTVDLSVFISLIDTIFIQYILLGFAIGIPWLTTLTKLKELGTAIGKYSGRTIKDSLTTW